MAYEYPLNENPVREQDEPECIYCNKIYPLCQCLACPCCGELTALDTFCKSCDICSNCCKRLSCPRD